MIEDFMSFFSIATATFFHFREMGFTKKQGALVPEAMNLKDMGTWVNFCTDVRKNSAKYNPGDLVGPLKQFADPMLTHMKRTMPLLDAALLKQYIQPDMLKSFETQLEARRETIAFPFQQPHS
ncbi:hypothetical protein RhiXN_07305 [Rhizoctonia solani]|uniref:Uncharacterized protein n=1 Tax=Rhizoctonia solani TaxID=456999 RepID=A0A8H8P7P0_9AGAM|nr:uncharacterized protein RhiXN_07305 [Rhizoctonia solani]QRW25356.1 hypothetical protein RhiXN_07305 [Rhizoctonia solani]